MARLTITLSDERHRKLKSQSALRGKSIAQLIEEGLQEADMRLREEGLRILALARSNAAEAEPKLTEDELMELAIEVTHEVRREMAEERRAARDS